MSEVLELQTEEVSLDLRVTKEFSAELTKLGISEEELREDAEKAMTVVIDGVDDKVGYKNADEVRKNLKVKRIAIQKTGKFMRDEANKFSKKVIERENELVGIIDEAESYVDGKQKAIKAERDRIEQEEQDRIASIFATRITSLSEIGVVFNGATFKLNDIVFQMADVRNSGDDLYQQAIFAPFYEQYQKNEAAQIEKDRVAKEELAKAEAARIEADRLRKEAEDKLAAERAEMERQQAEFRKQQEEFEAKRREAERIEEEKRQQELKKEREAAEKARQEEWEKQKAIEIEEQSKIAAEKAAKQERERIEAAQRDAELKKQQEEARKAEELAMATDKEKWKSFIAELSAIKIPEMRSGQYRKKAVIAKERLEEVTNQ
jgi:hypothetical protein